MTRSAVPVRHDSEYDDVADMFRVLSNLDEDSAAYRIQREQIVHHWLQRFDIVGMKDDRAIWVANFARGQAEHDVRVRRLSGFGVAPLDPHV